MGGKSCELQGISQHLATGSLSLGQTVSQLWSCFIWCFLQRECCRYFFQKPLFDVPWLPYSYQESHCFRYSFPQYTSCLKTHFLCIHLKMWILVMRYRVGSLVTIWGAMGNEDLLLNCKGGWREITLWWKKPTQIETDILM